MQEEQENEEVKYPILEQIGYNRRSNPISSEITLNRVC